MPRSLTAAAAQHGEHVGVLELDEFTRLVKELRKRVMELTAEDTDRASEVITEWIRVDAA